MPRLVTLTIPFDNEGKKSEQQVVVPTEWLKDDFIQIILDERVEDGSIKFIAYDATSQILKCQLHLGEGKMSTTISINFDPESKINRDFKPTLIEDLIAESKRHRSMLAPRVTV